MALPYPMPSFAGVSGPLFERGMIAPFLKAGPAKFICGVFKKGWGLRDIIGSESGILKWGGIVSKGKDRP